MRILYHHRTLGDGAEGIHVREMVKAFRELGHEVKVIGPVGEKTPEQSRKSHVLGAIKRSLPSALYECMEVGYTLMSFFTIWRGIKAFAPDFVYDRYIIFNAGSVLAARWSSVPLCLEVNAPLAFERSTEPDEKLVFRKVASRMESWVSANATQTIVVSTPLKQYLESIGVPKDKCIVMANGVDPVRFVPRDKDSSLLATFGIRPNQIVIGFTGVLRAWHGLDLLLKATADLAVKGVPVFLLIVGDGPYRQQLEKIVAELGIAEIVAVTGRLPHDRVPDHVALFDVAVSPRATFYASPMKVIEYMALGKPVVVPGTLNFLDIIDDGVNGLTFPDGDAEGLARSLEKLCGSAPARTAMGHEARKKVQVRLNWRWNADAVCRLFAGSKPESARAATAP
jgi:glycosyltransferase involved in cell wall biosynthesis